LFQSKPVIFDDHHRRLKALSDICFQAAADQKFSKESEVKNSSGAIFEQKETPTRVAN
jgi:hypothetical protein